MLLVISSQFSSYATKVHFLHEYLFEALVVYVSLSHYLSEKVLIDWHHALTNSCDTGGDWTRLLWELD